MGRHSLSTRKRMVSHEKVMGCDRLNTFLFTLKPDEHSVADSSCKRFLWLILITW